MAEEAEIREDAGNGADTDDLATLKARLEDERRKYSTLLNESKRLKDDKRKLADGLKSWNAIADEYNVEPEQVKALFAQQADADIKNARTQGEIDKLLANQRQSLEKQLAERDALIKSRDQKIEELTIDAQLDGELDKIKVKPSLKKALVAWIRPQCRLLDDPEAKHGLSVGVGVGDEVMPLHEWVKNWAETNPEADEFLQGSLAGGGGASAGAGGILRGVKPRSKMTPAEKSAYIRAKGKAEYDRLPWA